MYDRNSMQFVGMAGAVAKRFPWWGLGLAGVAALILALALGSPQPAAEARPLEAAEAAPETAGALPASGPHRLSLVDIVGKLSLVVLLGYAGALGLGRLRRGRWPLSAGPVVSRAGAGSGLQLHETLSLGRDSGALHLIEVQGQMLLIGSGGETPQVLWTAAPETTNSFEPVADDEPQEPERPAPTPPEESGTPLFMRHFGSPARRETDWAAQRSRLISALMNAE